MYQSNQSDYTPSHIANFFLHEEKHHITNIQINKLVYIALGFSLASLNRDLFDEEVQAWQYGPVIPSLYHEFKHFGRNKIGKMSNAFILKAKSIFPIINKLDTELCEVLDLVKILYNGKKGQELINLTHQKDTPWFVAYQPHKRNTVIDKKKKKKYYQGFLYGA